VVVAIQESAQEAVLVHQLIQEQQQLLLQVIIIIIIMITIASAHVFQTAHKVHNKMKATQGTLTATEETAAVVVQVVQVVLEGMAVAPVDVHTTTETMLRIKRSDLLLLLSLHASFLHHHNVIYVILVTLV